MRKHLCWLLVSCLLLPLAQGRAQNPLRQLLRSDSVLAPVLGQAAAHRVQILYTQIRRDSQGRAHFRSYGYRLRPREYFYPASSIKLPTAVLALEKLHALSAQVPGLTSESPLRIDSATWGQTRVVRDTSSQTGRASVAHYVRKVLLVSDNDAFNRLYEFVGPTGLVAGLRRHGLRHTLVRHRLSVGDQDSTARRANPLAFFADTSLTRPLYLQPAATYARPWPRQPRRGWRVGRAHLQGSTRVEDPLDFRSKNTTSLPDLQRTLRAVLFPETEPARRRFQLAPADYALLRDYLHRLPRESAAPRYPVAQYPDNYAKFLLAGGPAGPLPAGVQIYNKIGQAYGFLVDNAYITDSARGVEFLLSAVVYVNQDGVLNDDQYEYDTVGLPFLRRLGQRVYQYELQRRK
ncbi:class A beta-lactamase-related serine hydrolase [Hymenobacter sp. 5516J-16]|uniref:serine hydrolase n=1 Tax=Hymenobacter sp. 5516J-16 TaxID=2932253 RepID=UPI001FD529CA|nr:serine hydrolase [Hymenobacter sp. 5516J-16]UOQ78026.1 class A beta-lactamase-related serine hydrolase [Hymenobacter sp. 5516J-16]